MKRAKQLWCLQIDQIERIKAGVLKYIQSGQNSKSKEKSSRTPSTPHSPIRSGNVQTLKRSKDKLNQSQNQLYEQKTYRLKQFKRMEGAESMPKGFRLTKSGKIVRTDSPQGKQIEELFLQQAQKKPEGTIKKKNTIQSSVFSETKSIEEIKVIISPEIKLQKGQKINEQHNQPIQVHKPLIEQNKMPETVQKKQQPAQTKKTPSVFQLAKLFGGLSSKKEAVPITPQKNVVTSKAKFTDRNSAQKQMTVQSGEKISAQEIKSLASFGISDKSKGNIRISQFLDMRAAQNKKKQTQKQRKRSYTFQQNITSRQIQQISEKPNDIVNKNMEKNVSQQTQSNKYISAASHTRSSAKLSPSLKRIQFNQKQQQQLKNKYSILSQKLDELKSRVLEECEYMQKVRVDSKSPKQIRKQKIRLYNKYSPLKNLEKIRSRKIQESQINDIERERSRFIKFQNTLRSG